MCLIPTFMVRPLITRRENPPEIGQIQGDGSHVATIIERRVRIEFKYMYMWLMSRQIKKSLSIETECGFAKLVSTSLFKTKFLLFRCYKKKVNFLIKFLFPQRLTLKFMYFSFHTYLLVLPSHGHASFSILTSLHNSGTFLSRRGPETESVWNTL